MSSPTSLESLRRAIEARAKDFEIPALLDLLASLGYGPGQIEFRGKPARRPQPSLVEAVEFPSRSGEVRAVITVNLGLLSCRSPLPSYFQRFLRDASYGEGLTELLRLLDNSLLHTRLSASRPECVLSEWREVQHDFVRSYGLDSPLGLQWLCRQVFPELGVLVRRVTDERSVPFIGARLDNESKLGSCSLGRQTKIGVHELELVLICEDANYNRETPWIVEGDRRLREALFPLLDEVCFSLTVVFVQLDRAARARVSSSSYVGYDPMLPSSKPRPSARPAHVWLYRGELPREEPDIANLEQALAQRTRAALTVSPRHLSGRVTLGTAVELPLIYEAPGRRYGYRVQVEWGARAWYDDDPHAIRVAYAPEPTGANPVPKGALSPELHPRLWALARDAARQRHANSLAQLVWSQDDDKRVSEELIADLIRDDDYEGLFSLVWSTEAPMQQWDDDAWRRFSTWSAGRV